MGRCSCTWNEWDEEKDKNAEKSCQKETWAGSDEYCIFHDPSPDKDRDLFRKKLEEQMESETDKHNFRGYYFPENWDFSGQEFEIDVDFRRATFQYVDFGKATFQGNANFFKTTFQYATFYGATFLSDAYFGGTTFQDYAHFNEATFQDAYFMGTTFRGDAIFTEATFQDANFSLATFQKANFTKADFQKDATFRGATFRGTAVFYEATFQDATFKEATFQNATFRGATFRGTADFYEATFQDATFRGATFRGTADFSRATIQGLTYFRGAEFQDADFRGATFHKKVELAPKNNEKMDFRYTEFLFKSYITADLSKTLFHRASIENVTFVDCEWPDDYIIFEEKHMNDKEIDLISNQLETIYRDLKQNMQNHGDYTRAGKFYYREMEMRKKAMREKRFSLDWFKSSGYSLLKYTSGYGEKPERTAFSSLFIILLFATLYYVFDCLKYSVENPCLYQKIKDAVYFSFVTFTTLGLGDIHPIRDWGKALICIEAVIGAFLIALFVVVFVRKMAR